MTNGGWTLSTQWPITLFPCRLETRFVDAELLIRVIPDDIHADTHEPELTDAETAAGQSYWQQVSGTDDDGTALAAWRSLASQLGPARAAWVARVVRQSVLNQQVPFQPASRPATWTRVPYASLLPTRWTAVGWLGSERAQVTGIEITGPVPAGPDPSEGGQAMPLWMQFFGPAEDVGTAENIGMGLRLPLTADMQQNGLDLLLVYGVDESGDASAGAQALSELFDAHFYSDGFSYMAPGTPTTNTGDVSSGLDQRAQAYTDGYRVQAGNHRPPDRRPRRACSPPRWGSLRWKTLTLTPPAWSGSRTSPRPRRPLLRPAAVTVPRTGCRPRRRCSAVSPPRPGWQPTGR